MASAILDLEKTKEGHEGIDPKLWQTYDTICGIRDTLAHWKKHSVPHTHEDLRKYQQMLDAEDARRQEGIFGGSLRSGEIPAGQAALREVLDNAYDLLHALQTSAQRLNPDMAWVYGMLQGVKRKLERVRHNSKRAGHTHTFDELRHYQQVLNAVELKRKDGGIFCGSLEKNQIPVGQALCSDALAECHAIIEDLQKTDQEMNTHMRGIYGNLRHIHKQLEEIKSSGQPHKLEDLRTFQHQLDGMDRARTNGVFARNEDGTVPAGQAACAEALEESYEILKELQDSAVDANGEEGVEGKTKATPGEGKGGQENVMSVTFEEFQKLSEGHNEPRERLSHVSGA